MYRISEPPTGSTATDICVKFHIIKVIGVSAPLAFIRHKKYFLRFLLKAIRLGSTRTIRKQPIDRASIVAAKMSQDSDDEKKPCKKSRSEIVAMLTVYYDYRGVVHYEFLPPSQTVNK